MARVRYTASAQTDLLEAWLFIGEENPVAADRVLDMIEQEAGILSSNPLMGRLRPELAAGARSWPTHSTSCLMLPTVRASPYYAYSTMQGIFSGSPFELPRAAQTIVKPMLFAPPAR